MLSLGESAGGFATSEEPSFRLVKSYLLWDLLCEAETVSLDRMNEGGIMP